MKIHRSKEFITSNGAGLSGEWWEDRYEISDIARKLVRLVLLYFVAHEDKWGVPFLERLELGVERAS